MRPALVLILLLATAPAAAQPHSQSMAQCAAMYQTLTKWVTRPDRVEKLAHASEVFHQAAIAQATEEGEAIPEISVRRHADRARRDLEDRGRGWVATQDFRDWAGYCRKFARDRGLDISIG